MPRENKPDVSIRTICCYMASAFFEDRPFTGAELVRLAEQYNVWRASAPALSHKHDVYIVSKAPCSANLRSYLSEEASSSNGMVSRHDNTYKCNMHVVEHVKVKYAFPDQDIWRRHIGYTASTGTNSVVLNEMDESNEIIRGTNFLQK